MKASKKPAKQKPSKPIGLPADVAAINSKIREFFAILDESGVVLGTHTHAVYAFFDYDDEPIYVGQTAERLSTRISRHLTNWRTDAVAMNVLDPFEVAAIVVWPLTALVSDLPGEANKKARKAVLDRAEYTVYKEAVEKSYFKAVLNEKEIAEQPLLPLPMAYRGEIIPEAIYKERIHPDVRLARRATTIASLARVISERSVSYGLRKTLLTQAKRLQHLAQIRFAELAKKPAAGTEVGATDSTTGWSDLEK